MGAPAPGRTPAKTSRGTRRGFSPSSNVGSRTLRLRSELGDVKLVVDYGQHPDTGCWCCPVREAWHLGPHQKITPGFAEKLCFTATATGSYEEAAQVASKWAQSMDDSTLHALVQRAGARAEGQAQSRYEQLPEERLPQRGPSELGVLMVDGCQMRYRGPGWGKKKTKKERVEWHELKLGVFYRHEESAHTEGGRGLLIDKIVVNWQDQSMELGRRLHWEALREGLGRARKVLVLGRWSRMGVEPQEGSLERRDGTPGLLSRQRTFVEFGTRFTRGTGTGALAVGRTTATPTATRSGTTSPAPDCSAQETTR